MIFVCGDFNINYLSENDKRKQLDAMSILYILTSAVDFPIRIQNKSSTAIDSIFINIVHFNNFIITPIVNGPSDHDAQPLTINEINPAKQTCHAKTICDINKNSIINTKLN
jgi:hypothetical protein